MTEVARSQTPPILQGPSEKEKKYDRQLRLWAASGQAALESANILLLNSGSGTAGVETLKNLVLPGIGRFTIADDSIVKESDLGVNFFLDEGSIGQSRAQRCMELLLELNPEVQGDWFPKNKESLNLQQVLEGSDQFTVILYTLPISPDHLKLVEAYGREGKTPLISVHSAGFYSYFRIAIPGPFPIVDTHPDDTATTDLRLLTPWEELSTFAKELTADIEGLDAHAHGHIPFVAILLHYLEVWKEAHNGASPSNYSEKVAFRKLVSEAARTANPEGGEENFEEAVSAVLKTISPPSLPSTLKQVFEYSHKDPSEKSSGFWVIADAVKIFYDRHKSLPVTGGVPDMKAQSETYIKLQNIYKAKARKDAAEVLEIARQLPFGDAVGQAEVDLFCKNAAFVKLIEATDGNPGRLQAVAEQEFANDEMAKEGIMPMSLLPIYLALHATSHVSTATPEEILASVNSVVPRAGDNERVVLAAKEVSRSAGGELHNVSAVIGGMVAQEMIKIITKQYIPIDNTCIFDGIGSRCQVLRL